jgi:hypothetical protein
VREWYTNYSRKILNEVSFAPLQKKAIEFGTKPEKVVNDLTFVRFIHLIRLLWVIINVL